MEPETTLDDRQQARISSLVEERKKGRPLAYLTRSREFFSETFYVDEGVLIPRPETELLVEEGLAVLKEKGPGAEVLDVGTGSGIIGILLAKGGALRPYCLDVSPLALAVAQKNSVALGVEDRVHLVASDLLTALNRHIRFDLVCANLPYVSDSEWEDLMDDVRCFEPREALLGGAQGTEVYERLIATLPPRLNDGAVVLLEIGSDRQAEIVGNLLEKTGFEAETKRDLSGRERVVKGSWTNLS